MKRAAARARPARSTPPRPAAPHRWWWPALIVFAGVVAYANSLSAPFMFDDFGTVVRNPQIRNLANVGAVLSPPAETAVAGRPLVNLSFALNYALGDLDPTGYHVVNIALHIACALLAFGLIRRTAQAGLAFAVALLWVVHPLNSEVVTYVTERTESLMAVCYLLTLYASVRAAGASGSRWQVTAILACAAGMASKETMVTAPLMVVLYDWIFVFGSLGQALRARWRLYAGLAATWLLLAALVASQGQTFSAGFASARTSSWTYLLNQPEMLLRYFWLSIWPRALVLYYGWPRPVSLAAVWPYALVVIGLFAVTVVAIVRRPRLGFLGAWIFMTLAPSSSIIPVATEVGAERRMYLPLIALITLAVLAAVFLWKRFATLTPTLVLAILLAAGTIARNREYLSTLTMAETVLARWPTPNAHALLGTELAAAGRHEEAIDHLRQAVNGYPPARYFLGSELYSTGKLDDAIQELQTFVREEPRLPLVRTARLVMARAFELKQQWPLAIEQSRMILSSAPADADARGLLAEALARQQVFGEAIPEYQAFLAARPDDTDAWTGLGIALSAIGRPAEAAAALAMLGRIDEARRELMRSLQIDPAYQPAIDALRRIGDISSIR